MYLKARESVVLNYNPFIVFHNDPKPEYQNRVKISYIMYFIFFHGCFASTWSRWYDEKEIISLGLMIERKSTNVVL